MGHAGGIELIVLYVKGHRGPDPIKLNYWKKAQRVGSHENELWEKGTAGWIPLN
jgi:hypothetical protein